MANVIVERLTERRVKAWEAMKAISETAADENRALSAEEEGAWQTANAELDALDKKIANTLEGEKRAKDAEDTLSSLAGERHPENGNGDGNDSELRAFLRGERGRSLDIMPTGQVNFRTLSKLTNAAGAYTVPTEFYERLMAHLIETSAMLRANPTVLNTAGGEVIQVPKTLTHASVTTPTAEAGTIAASDPTFGQISLGAFKYGVLIQVSRELLSDTGVDLDGYLAMQAGRAIGNAIGQDFVTGVGTTEPRGVTIDTTLGVTGGTAVVGVFTADNLIDLYFSVIEPYRNSSSCCWMLRDASVAVLRKLKDSTNQYLWQPGLQAGVPDLVLGKPVVTDPNVAATALNAKSVIFGDFSQYFVRFAGGFRFERSDDFAFNTDLVTFRALLRGDGALIDLTGAVKHFVGGAS